MGQLQAKSFSYYGNMILRSFRMAGTIFAHANRKLLLTNTSMNRCSRVVSKPSSLAAKVMVNVPIRSPAPQASCQPFRSQYTLGVAIGYQAKLPLVRSGNS